MEPLGGTRRRAHAQEPTTEALTRCEAHDARRSKSDGRCAVLIDLSFGALFNATSGLLIAVIGIWVGTVRPRAGNLAFAIFAGAWGLSLVPNNLVTETSSPLAAAALAAESILLMIAVIGLALVGSHLPRPVQGRDRATFGAVALLWAVSLSAATAALMFQPHGKAGLSAAAGVWFLVRAVMTPAFLGALWGLIILLGVRTTRWASQGLPGNAHDGRLMAMALVPFGGAIAAIFVFLPPNGTLIDEILSLTWTTAVFLTWTVAALVRAGRANAVAILLVWSSAFMVGAIFQLTTSIPADRLTSTSMLWGTTRFVAVAVIAYAIIRNQLFDVDIKVKWTINRSTLAGIFIAVFFVATVTAENFLTDRYGWAIGGIGAGLLLFALTPLQRLADRVADTAMPHVQDNETYHAAWRREVYLNAVESALADGHVTARERDILATLASDLALTPKEALAIERDAVSGVD